LPGSDKVAAQALFEDGRTLVAAGKYSEACPKFADSERLDSSASTLLNLANCWEKLGRSATAWATYKEAESAANAAKRQDYMATAQRHADALAPKLSRLIINVQQPIASMRVLRDGVLVGSAQWGSAIPVDPGSRTVEVSAPGYKGWLANVEVSRDGAQYTLTVPPLEPLPAEAPPPAASVVASTAAIPSPAAPPAPAPEATSRGSAQRTIGLVVAGAGAVGLGVSAVFALVANSKNKDSLRLCDKTDPNACTSAGVSERNDALSAGDAATVALGLGGAALVAGALLWFASPSGASATGSSAARVVVLPAVGGAVVKGTW
jgi:serine/threonine-protein kinase